MSERVAVLDAGGAGNHRPRRQEATPNAEARGLWFGLLGVVIFAMTLPMTRLAVGATADPQLPPLFVTAGRAAVAGLLSVAYLVLTRAPCPRRGQWMAFAVCAAGTVVGFPWFLALAVRDVDAMHAAVVTGVLPLGTALAAALFFRQRPSAGFWLCAIAGCALVLAFAAHQSHGELRAADGLLLLAVASASVGYVAGARLSAQMRAEQVICWVLVLSLPFTLPVMLAAWPAEPVRASAWGGFGYVTLFSMWLGFFAWYRGLALGGTVRVSQVQLVQPFLSLLFAVPVLGETLSANDRRLLARGDRHRVPGQAHARRSGSKDVAMNSAFPFRPARRAEAMNPSVIREILKLTERPGVISFAGGLPSAQAFPVQAMREACDRVLRDTPHEALQYAASEGYPPLRQWVADELAKQGLAVGPAQVLVTTGSQQGLDLLGKVLVNEGSTVLVESPTYLGALQAFAPTGPRFASVAGDDAGPDLDVMEAAAAGADARFFYLLPNFQNPTGRSIGEARRAALVERAAAIGLPLVEDDPYGDLWFDAPPPRSLAGRHPAGTVYLGSFSKVLAPGMRLGYLVAPPALMPKLLQAKQAADLHTPGFNQRVVHEVIRNGFLDHHVPTIRALYKSQRDAMLAALDRHMPPGTRWNRPAGGMFLWLRLPAGLNAAELLPKAVERGVAFVPGAPFFAGTPQANTLRLSFVTATAAQIEAGIAALGEVVRAAQETAR